MSADELADLVKIEDPSFYDNAVPIYQRLQNEAPVFYYAPLNIFVLTKHEDMLFAEQRKDIYSAAGALLLSEIMYKDPEEAKLLDVFFQPTAEMSSYTDPPRHRTLRRIITPSFTPR